MSAVPCQRAAQIYAGHGCHSVRYSQNICNAVGEYLGCGGDGEAGEGDYLVFALASTTNTSEMVKNTLPTV